MKHFNIIGFQLMIVCLILLNSTNALYSNGTIMSNGFERNGKFLFDTLFGLETPSNDEDDDDETSNDVKACNCGQ